MPAPPIVLIDETAGRPVVLRLTGDRGAESELCRIDGRPDEVALIPAIGGAYPPMAGNKLRALIAMKIDFGKTGIAAPTAVLRDPKGPARDAPVHGFICPKVEGVGLDAMTSTAERRRLGIDCWEPEDRTPPAINLVKRFATHEKLGLIKLDHNPPNWRYDPQTGQFYSIDPLSLAFEWNGWHGTGVARREMVAPELQRHLTAGTLAAERIGVEQERFALAAMLFLWFCDALPTDYAGASTDAVQRKEFACVSAPPGARVSTDVQVAFLSLSLGLQNLLIQGLVNQPSQRPGPDLYLRELRAALPPRPAKARPSWRAVLDRFPFDRRKAGMAACLAMALGWTALKPPRQPEAAPPVVESPRPGKALVAGKALPPGKALVADVQPEQQQPGPRNPRDPNAWMKFGKRVVKP